MLFYMCKLKNKGEFVMTNKITRIIALLMVMSALFSVPVLCESADMPFSVTASAAQAKAPKLSATKKTVYYKSKATLKVSNYSKKVKWSTSNKNVATVDSKGVVTGVGLGTCTVTAKAGSKNLKCKITVKDRDLKASVSFKVSSGYFVKGESSATVTVKPLKYSCAKATVYIKDAEGDTVYKKTLKSLTKNKKYSFTWNGKNSKGKYVSGGSYRAVVKIGDKKTNSSYLTFYSKNDFADGNGSKSNPFIIQTGSQLKKIVKYPKGYFKQANDIDFNYTAVGNLFSADQPFNGTYNGNGKTIMNISGNAALFRYVGKKGVIKNVKTKNCTVIASYGAVLVCENYGKISKCDINGIVSGTFKASSYMGLIVSVNYGRISDCVSSGSITGCTTEYGGTETVVGGIAAVNKAEGKVINCTSSANLSATAANYPYVGGITGHNNGQITNCEANGTVAVAKTNGFGGELTVGGISAYNSGSITSSYYTGATVVNLVGRNTGVIS